mgnify:CR=1 FL=1|tara:strand:- start:43 stop:669 length:627 start_codon:yes stop_codon:yes gene_type:complete
MGSLITALQNQSIAESNADFVNDTYAANPTNLGYTANPFGYAASPAVQQTAYPKYGVNATSPNIPESYEDYDLTSLFSMLQGMQGTEGGQTQYTGLSPQAAEAAAAGLSAEAPTTGIMQQVAALQSPVENAYRTPAYDAANQPDAPVVAEPVAKKEVAAAAPEMSLGEYIRQGKTDPELLRQVQAVSKYQVNPNISRDEAYAILIPQY